MRGSLRSLGIGVPETFRNFYERYEGPFSSERTAFVLLDLCEQVPNVIQASEMCRKEHDWPSKLFVLSELLGNAVLVLDAQQDRVFNVDFEGGDEQLLNGQLAPSWQSFADFIAFYFGPTA